MRFLLILLGLIVLAAVVYMSFGGATFNIKAGSLPSFHVDGGTAPQVKANVATLSVGTENKTIEVPTVTTTTKTITVPTMHMQKPADGNSTAQ